MKAVALYGTAGVLVLSGLAALAAAPPGSADAPAGTYADVGGPGGGTATAPGTRAAGRRAP